MTVSDRSACPRCRPSCRGAPPRPHAPRLRAADRRVLGYPESRAFAELLIDREEDRTLRAVLVGMLRAMRLGSAAR
jgi:hypothetical protein